MAAGRVTNTLNASDSDTSSVMAPSTGSMAVLAVATACADAITMCDSCSSAPHRQESARMVVSFSMIGSSSTTMPRRAWMVCQSVGSTGESSHCDCSLNVVTTLDTAVSVAANAASAVPCASWAASLASPNAARARATMLTMRAPPWTFSVSVSSTSATHTATGRKSLSSQSARSAMVVPWPSGEPSPPSTSAVPRFHASRRHSQSYASSVSVLHTAATLTPPTCFAPMTSSMRSASCSAVVASGSTMRSRYTASSASTSNWAAAMSPARWALPTAMAFEMAGCANCSTVPAMSKAAVAASVACTASCRA